jgi:predicted acylesterase/phospholipase RssA
MEGEFIWRGDAVNDDSLEPKIFRILSLDGGGAKGFYTLGALKEIEALVECRLCEKFDLIYGTSTGAIIAALAGLGRSVDEIEALYRKHVVTVMANWLPSQRTAALEALAAEVFGELKFDAFKTDMGIVGTRWKEERPIIFKTNRRQAFLGKATFEPGFGCTIGDAVVGSCSAYPFFKKKFVTTGRGEKIEVRDGGFVANNPALYAIVDATESLGFARKAVRVVSVGVGEYPPPKLPAWSLRKWASKLPTMVFLQKTMEISTQSMDQLRKVLFRDVKTARIHAKYTQPEMATDLLEVDLEKLGLLWQRGRDCARDVESDLRKFLT